MYRAVLLLLILLNTALPSHADEASVDMHASFKLLENAPSVATSQAISRLFKEATTIEIRYTPVNAMGRAPLDASEAFDAPRYVLSINCPSRQCSGRIEDLHAALVSGRLVKGQCERPITTVISFVKAGQYLQHIYLSPLGGCYSLGDRSYLMASQDAVEGILSRVVEILEGR